MLEEKDGPEGFTVREAARRLRVDHRAAYRHFEDRKALLAVIAEESYRELVEAVDRELARAAVDDHAARLRAIARAYVEFATGRPGRYRVMTGPRVKEDGRFPELETALAGAFHLLRREVQGGIDAGVFEAVDVTEPVLTLWAGMHGVASLIAMRRLGVRRDGFGNFAERAIGHTVRGFSTGRQ